MAEDGKALLHDARRLLRHPSRPFRCRESDDRRRGETKKAHALYREAVRVLSKNDDRAALADAFHGLGHACWERSQHEASAKAWLRAATLYEQLKDFEGSGWSLLDAGVAGWLRNQNEFAFAQFEAAERAFTTGGCRAGRAMAIDEQAWTAHQSHDHIRAAKLLWRGTWAFAVAGQPVLALWSLVRCPLDLLADRYHRIRPSTRKDMTRAWWAPIWGAGWGRGGRWR